MSAVVEPGQKADSPSAEIGIVWFRNDLRLTDHRPLQAAILCHTQLVCVYVHDSAQDHKLPAGFCPMGPHRRHFLAETLRGLQAGLVTQQQSLWVRSGDPAQCIAELARMLGSARVYCEEIAAPFEQDQIDRLRTHGRAAGFAVETFWQSSLLEPEDLPFDYRDLPQIFTEFRRRIERARVRPRDAVPAPRRLPPAPGDLHERLAAIGWCSLTPQSVTQLLSLESFSYQPDSRSSFPFFDEQFAAGEARGLAHLARYFGGLLPQTYKETRNGLVGTDYSTKLSPWLATGALSPRTVWQALCEHEARVGANESTYWIAFELWWRDYFRFLHLQHGRRLYRARGLSDRSQADRSSVARSSAARSSVAFDEWSSGTTGQAFIDAAMRELAVTGYLSNRMRQNVASFWVNDLHGDWRLGAAWFEHCLIDYDVYSNQGNWLYLAGCGTDPRSGRRFEPLKQANVYDPTQSYRRLWG